MHGKSKHMEIIVEFFRDTLSSYAFSASGFMISCRVLSYTRLFLTFAIFTIFSH